MLLNPEVLLYHVCIPYIRDPDDVLNAAVTFVFPYVENRALRVSKFGEFIKEWWSRTHHHATIAWRRNTSLARQLCYSCVIGNDENALRPSQETIRKALEVALYRENRDYIYWAVTNVSPKSASAQDGEVFSKSQKWLSEAEQHARGQGSYIYKEGTTFGVDLPWIEDCFPDDSRESNHLDAIAHNFSERMKLTFCTYSIYETMMMIDLCDRRIRSRVLNEHLGRDDILTWIRCSNYDTVLDIIVWIAIRIKELGNCDDDFIDVCRKELIRTDYDCFRICLLYRKLNDNRGVKDSTNRFTIFCSYLMEHRDAPYRFIADCMKLYGKSDNSGKERLVCVIRGLLRNIIRSKDRYILGIHYETIEMAMMAMLQNSGDLVRLFLDAYLSLRRNPDARFVI